jgi:GT2 family glycosyltransferase
MLHESILSVVRQSIPSRIIVSVPDSNHVADATRALPSVEIVTGKRGLTAQRNAALAAIQGNPEVIVFLDDDMEIDEHYVEELVRAYREHPQAALINGNNLALGIYPAGSLDRKIAVKLIQDRLKTGASRAPAIPADTGYGCLMSMRGSLLGKVSFDERLPLYGFMEDFDFTLLCRKFGAVLQNPNALCVHIEIVAGRMGERRRGYSEVVNPIYIWSKKTGSRLPRAFLGAVRRTLRSAGMALKGQGTERLIGNLIGWANVATFRPDPEKILTMR